MPAFTATQRTAVRRALGYATRFFQTDPTATRLEQALNAVDSMTLSGDPSGYTEVVGMLDAVAARESAILAGLPLTRVAQLGKIAITGAEYVAAQRFEGRRVVGQLAAFLGVDVLHDRFSSTLSRRDSGEVVNG